MAATVRRLAQYDDPEARAAVALALGHPYRSIRQLTREMLLAQGVYGERLRWLADHATDADQDLCKRALGALGDSRDTSALPALLQALDDPRPVVRRAAIQALQTLGRQEAVPALRARLPEADPTTAIFILEGLLSLWAPVTASDLESTLRSGSDTVCRAAIQLLHRHRPQDAARLLVQSARLQDPTALQPVDLVLLQAARTCEGAPAAVTRVLELWQPWHRGQVPDTDFAAALARLAAWADRDRGAAVTPPARAAPPADPRTAGGR
jgi:HEAT repeat protein